ncbi:bifunctional adenosylcobinamide kinase/adenosylcobinamide-phosphate guanylyltransferase [Hydrogenophaga sp. 5NK40-0174]|uniref:bifunctional adenosylcobinamide kinase/adenosylcobinamide-phosphate guanylyltransferase n=1 Tax=Hydrogenophaga sp. 5NK40-0174 TaxID=3127649 RepID=UPI00333EA418
MTGVQLVLGGQRSGKSRQAESLAEQWLESSQDARVVFVATAMAHDDEMQQRIERHRQDRAERMPGVHTVEEHMALSGAISAYSAPSTLMVVDCLTLWLTNWLMPVAPAQADPAAWQKEKQAFLHALSESTGPVVVVSNEIGLGVIPMGEGVRQYVDELGQLNQAVARRARQVTLMVAGLPLRVTGDDA